MQQLIWPAFFLLLCGIGWIVFSIAISYMSGWWQLAKVYRANRPCSGERFRPWAASMRSGVNYNGLLTLAADTQGLYLAVSFLLRAGHPPLFIPWAEISASPERRWWFRLAKLRFKGYESTFLLIPARFGEKLSQASGFQFKRQETA